MPFSKSIDFERIHDLYDPMVADVTFDLPFWIEVARAASPPRLELMCGTGRITLPILAAGLEIERAAFDELFQTADAKTGIMAFVNKEQAEFRGS